MTMLKVLQEIRQEKVLLGLKVSKKFFCFSCFSAIAYKKLELICWPFFHTLWAERGWNCVAPMNNV